MGKCREKEGYDCSSQEYCPPFMIKEDEREQQSQSARHGVDRLKESRPTERRPSWSSQSGSCNTIRDSALISSARLRPLGGHFLGSPPLEVPSTEGDTRQRRVTRRVRGFGLSRGSRVSRRQRCSAPKVIRRRRRLTSDSDTAHYTRYRSIEVKAECRGFAIDGARRIFSIGVHKPT